MDAPQPTESAKILRALNEAGVDYVVVGGLAGNLHGSSYPTFDLDVAYARDAGNLLRLVKGLEPLEVRLTNAPPDLPFALDDVTLANGSNFTFDTKYGRFDVLGHVGGIATYDELRRESKLTDVDDVPVRVASIDHLIAMKREANRTKDKLMVEEYLVIADEQDRGGRSESER